MAFRDGEQARKSRSLAAGRTQETHHGGNGGFAGRGDRRIGDKEKVHNDLSETDFPPKHESN